MTNHIYIHRARVYRVYNISEHSLKENLDNRSTFSKLSENGVVEKHSTFSNSEKENHSTFSVFRTTSPLLLIANIPLSRI